MTQFQARGTYILISPSHNLIGEYGTLAKAKVAARRDAGNAPVGAWKEQVARFEAGGPTQYAYFSNAGYEILVGRDHPRCRFTDEDFRQAKARAEWRERTEGY